MDSKDLTLGMSCPSPAFVEEGLLMVARELLSSQGGCGFNVGVVSRLKFGLVELWALAESCMGEGAISLRVMIVEVSTFLHVFEQIYCE